MNCPNCKSQVDAGSSFCVKCGYQLKQPRGPQDFQGAAARPAAQPFSMSAPPPAHAPQQFSMTAPQGGVVHQIKKINPKPAAPPARVMRVAQTKIVQGRFKLDECLGLFEELAAFDENTDKLRAAAVKNAVLSFVAAFISIFITAFSGFAPLVGLVIAAAVNGIIQVARWSKLRKQDLINDFRLCVVPLLEMLREDISPKERLKIDINLSGPAKEKIVSKQELDPSSFGPNVQKVTRTIFSDPWCRMEIPLLDGNTVGLAIENYYLKFDRRQRGSSGKIKFKTKWKKRSVARARLEPKPSGFAWDLAKAKQQPPEHKLKMKDKPGAAACRVARKFKYKPEDRMLYTAESKPNFGQEPTQMDTVMHPRELFAMMLELFSLLTPLKTGSE